jgi:hypothetical protein
MGCSTKPVITATKTILTFCFALFFSTIASHARVLAADAQLVTSTGEAQVPATAESNSDVSISLEGPNDIAVQKGKIFKDPGATAKTRTTGKDISEQILKDVTVDSNRMIITYRVGETQVHRVVRFVDSEPNGCEYSLTFKITNIGLGLGAGWGEAILRSDGVESYFHVRTFGLAEAGFWKSGLEGCVSNLKKPQDLVGQYVVMGAALTPGVGASFSKMYGGNNISIHTLVTGITMGLGATIGFKSLTIEFRR